MQRLFSESCLWYCRSSLSTFFFGYLAIPALIMGLVGIVLAGISMSKNHKGTAGLVLSIISTVFSFIPAIIWIIAIIAVVR